MKLNPLSQEELAVSLAPKKKAKFKRKSDSYSELIEEANPFPNDPDVPSSIPISIRHSHNCEICGQHMLYHTTNASDFKRACSIQCESLLRYPSECYICAAPFMYDPQTKVETCPDCQDHILADDILPIK